jgi:hypothetical protein
MEDYNFHKKRKKISRNAIQQQGKDLIIHLRDN